MAVVWQKRVNGRLHEVRKAGNSIRLYTDGVFHSQFNPRHPVGGHVWDLLMLPAFFLERNSVNRVLVLGSGGGAVMRQLTCFFHPSAMIGIDYNPVHHAVAREHFGIKGKPYQLIEADACEYLDGYSGAPFDLVIDDLYGEHNGEPERAIPHDAEWFEQLHRIIKPDGILVMNFMSLSDFRRSAWWTNRSTRLLFPGGCRLSTPRYDNIVGVFASHILDEREFRRRLLLEPALDHRRKTTRLQYHLRKLN